MLGHRGAITLGSSGAQSDLQMLSGRRSQQVPAPLCPIPWECSPQALSLRPSDLDGTTARLHCGSVGQEGCDRGCAGDAVGAVKPGMFCWMRCATEGSFCGKNQ